VPGAAARRRRGYPLDTDIAAAEQVIADLAEERAG
jgi:hypothetical protein